MQELDLFIDTLRKFLTPVRNKTTKDNEIILSQNDY